MKNKKTVMCVIATFFLCVSMIFSVHAGTLTKICKGKHSWKVTSTKKATCTKNGTKYYKCKKCDSTKKESIKKLGHDWSKVKKIDAYKHGKKCSRCNKTKETANHSPTKETKNNSTQVCKCGAKRKVIVLKGRKMTTKEWNK